MQREVGAVHFAAKLCLHHRCFDAEFREDAMVAGQIDSVWVDPVAKSLHMIDWKRCFPCASCASERQTMQIREGSY